MENIKDIYEQTNDEIIKEIGKRFKDYRLRHNLTQDEVAEHAGISRVTLGAFERGSSASISLKAFVRILRAIGELNEISSLLPVLPMSPKLLMEIQNKVNKNTRKRARGNGQQ